MGLITFCLGSNSWRGLWIVESSLVQLYYVVSSQECCKFFQCNVLDGILGNGFNTTHELQLRYLITWVSMVYLTGDQCLQSIHS